MADSPQNPDDQNPFRGTPLEQIFGALSGQGGQTPDLGALFGQMQQMFSEPPGDGPVNWSVAGDVARRTLAASGDDPSPHSGQIGAVDDAARLAESWLDRATDVPAAATSTAAWSRAEWIEATAGSWRRLVEPIADHVVDAMGEAMPQEARAMAGPLLGMLKQAGGAMFAQQVGQALAALAGEVVSSTDIGLPMGPRGVAAVVPRNVETFGEGLEVSQADVLLYITLRECAHHRLFAHAPWLEQALVGAVDEYSRGTSIDLGAIEEQVRGLDPSRPEELAEAMQGGLFEPRRTAQQEHAAQRLETLLALVEGWVDDVVGQAAGDMPSAPALAEAMRRRRATAGPAEQTFASLVGLELRPRRLRDAANLWAAVRDRSGAAARDDVWTHPDLMPTTEDLDDPLGYAAGERATEVDFDAELDALLSQEPDPSDSSDKTDIGDPGTSDDTGSSDESGTSDDTDGPDDAPGR